MINYYIRPGGAFVKINTDTQIVDLILNTPSQQTVSTIQDNLQYYNTTVQMALSWETTDQTVYETNKNAVLQFLSGR